MVRKTFAIRLPWESTSKGNQLLGFRVPLHPSKSLRRHRSRNLDIRASWVQSSCAEAVTSRNMSVTRRRVTLIGCTLSPTALHADIYRYLHLSRTRSPREPLLQHVLRNSTFVYPQYPVLYTTVHYCTVLKFARELCQGSESAEISEAYRRFQTSWTLKAG